MTVLKPFDLYYLGTSGNPWKVAMILEELGLPYNLKKVRFEDVKKEPVISLNPNGRVPILIDPNNDGITLWESGAIIEYLIELYDKEGTLTYTSSPQKHHLRTWVHFQMSGQGPYFGQAGWFNLFHPEKLPSVIERYEKEVARVIGVIELHLTRQGTDYLIGDKVTYADIMFVPYFSGVSVLAPTVDTTGQKAYTAWLNRLSARPAVKRVLERIAMEKELLEAEAKTHIRKD